MKKYSNVAIIIPAYNEGRIIKSVLEEVLKTFPFVVCVNDGSRDNTGIEARKTKANVLNHLINIGQGGSLETGIKYALSNPEIDYFVTFDADGQHKLSDVLVMLDEIEKSKVDIILGSRFINKTSNIPTVKKFILYLARIFTNWTTGLNLTDTHNGLRVFNRKFAQKVNLKNFNYAHASEFLDIIKNNQFKFTEVPMTVEYTEYSKSKGQPIINAVNIVFDIFFK